MKDKNYIRKIEIIAGMDIRNGNKEKLKMKMKRLIKDEEYEDCEGINNALIKIEV